MMRRRYSRGLKEVQDPENRVRTTNVGRGTDCKSASEMEM
jgi:hypothetical protein